MHASIWKIWHTDCVVCKGIFKHECWLKEVPMQCRCGGVLRIKNYGSYNPTGTPPPPVPIRVSTKDPNVILRDMMGAP
jgi:hypothetical protein